MRERIAKISVLTLLLVALLVPSAGALVADEEASWTTLAPMLTKRIDLQAEVIDGKIYAMGGRSSTTLASTELFDPSANAWTTLASMSDGRSLFQTEVINGKIYAIGGSGSGSILSSAEVYDPSTNTWTRLASMSIPRYYFKTEVIDGKIYAIGGNSGRNGTPYLSSVEVYDPSTNTWTTLASMSTPRLNLQTEVIDGKIYAIGGGYSSVLPSAEVYDPSTDTWMQLASMSAARCNFQTEVINGKIYAIGGNNDGNNGPKFISSAEVYNPSTNTWTKLASMSAARGCFRTEVINGKIYAIGGYDGSSKYLSSTEVYDPSTNVWTTLTPMSTGKVDYFPTVIVDGKIYAVDSSSVECYTVKTESVAKQLKVVLGVGENLQLSVSNDLSKNENVTWASSDSGVTSVDTNGIATAVAPGNAIITVTGGDSYTESIHILVVKNADDYRLAVDLKVDKTCRLTMDDYTNTFAGTWTSMDPSVATVSSSGKVKAAGAGLALITASGTDGNEIGQVYVRVRA